MSKINNFPSHSTNPFRIDSGAVKPVKKTRYGNPEFDGSKYVAEVEGTGYSLGDFQDHIRVFSDLFNVMGELSSTAIDVLTYIFKETLSGSDEVYLNVSSLVKTLNLKSRTSGYLAISDLLDKQVIARKVGSDTYFINPAMFFGGSRVDWYKKYSEVDKTLDAVEKSRRVYPVKSKIA